MLWLGQDVAPNEGKVIRRSSAMTIQSTYLLIQNHSVPRVHSHQSKTPYQGRGEVVAWFRTSLEVSLASVLRANHDHVFRDSTST